MESNNSKHWHRYESLPSSLRQVFHDSQEFQQPWDSAATTKNFDSHWQIILTSKLAKDKHILPQNDETYTTKNTEVYIWKTYAKINFYIVQGQATN